MKKSFMLRVKNVFSFSVLALVLLFALRSETALGQALINPTTWTGSGTSAIGPSTFTSLPATTTPGSSAVNVSQWNRAGSLGNTATASCFNTNNWQVGGSLAIAQASNSYIFFSVSTDASTEVIIDSIVLESQVAASGPADVQLMYNLGGADIAFGSAVTVTAFATPVTLTFIPSSPLHLCASVAATFKLYGWGAASAIGTLRINNNSLISARYMSPVAVATIAGPTNVCAGAAITLTNDSTGGTWTTADATVATVNSLTGLVTGVTAGTTNITYSISNSCGIATDIASITVNPAPGTPAAIAGITTVCTGFSTTLSNAVPGGTWTTDAAGIASVNAFGQVTGITAGTANISYTISNSCGSNSVSATVTVNATPAVATISGSTVVCETATITLTNDSTGGAWSTADATIASVNS
ncbi:MAG: Ig-like domain-containing protein, partial [Taibaiella sp.]|nr:Ig-like domain-containing protein [Taibaiella sp.]